MKTTLPLLGAALAFASSSAALAQNAPPARPAADAQGRPRADAHGNALRYNAVTGHVSNYDEDKVGEYALPPLLVLNDGRPVADAAAWQRLRRPEILELYRHFIYGRVPATAPKVSWAVEPAAPALGGAAVRKVVVGTLGGGRTRRRCGW